MEKKDIDLFFKKDERAVKKVYEEYYHLLKSLSFSILNDEASAQDCVQDTFLAALTSSNYVEKGYFKAYLCQICRHISLKKLGETSRKIPLDQDIATQGINDNSLISFVRSKLDKDEYEIFVLKVVEKMKFKEIAKIYQVKASSIKGKYYRALKKLQAELSFEEEAK